jgi:Tfp pilus assembly protein PilO
MERNRLLLFAAGLAAVVIVAGGFFVGVQPQLSAASDARSQEATVATQNASLKAATAKLQSANKNLTSLKSQLGVLKNSVPEDGASADLIREYNSLAQSTGTTIVNITTADAVAYTPPASTVPAATPTSTASASPSASATATPSPTATSTVPAAPVATTNTLITAANFSAIPVTVEIQGSYAQALGFMKGLHDGKRLFLVTQVASAATGGAQNATPNDWTISGLVYALSDAASTNAQQQTSTSTAAGTTPTGSSSTDTAAGK